MEEKSNQYLKHEHFTHSSYVSNFFLDNYSLKPFSSTILPLAATF